MAGRKKKRVMRKRKTKKNGAQPPRALPRGGRRGRKARPAVVRGPSLCGGDPAGRFGRSIAFRWGWV